MELIGWIGIGILFFYMIRNIWAGSWLYPLGFGFKESAKKYLKIEMPFRNYYLFVLNPFWWTMPQVFKNKDDRRFAREVIKEVKNIYSNLLN